MQQPYPRAAIPVRPAPAPARRAPDDLQAPFVTILALGAVSALLLVLGLSNLVLASMPWAHTGLHASVSGVYTYDRSTGTVGSEATKTFPRGQAFAARVDWAALPGDLSVGAAWYGPDDAQVGGVGPAPARDLAARQAPAPMTDLKGPSGRYTLLVMHYVDNQPIEILARQAVRVTA